jgi:E3 SUMO-protein ligase PIAS1
LTANLKGLKKKPGTAPPADLGKGLRVNTAQNRVEMVYVNSQQPVQAKVCCHSFSLANTGRLSSMRQKFYLVVMLVEVTSVDQLVDRLKKGKYKSSDDIKHRSENDHQNLQSIIDIHS